MTTVTVKEKGGHRWWDHDSAPEEVPIGTYRLVGEHDFPLPTVECVECGGSGEANVGFDGQPCPACVDGRVPDPKVVETTARAHHQADWPDWVWVEERPRVRKVYCERARLGLLAVMREATP